MHPFRDFGAEARSLVLSIPAIVPAAFSVDGPAAHIYQQDLFNYIISGIPELSTDGLE
jgi:hypothetical protein